MAMDSDFKPGPFIVNNGQFRVRLKDGIILPSLQVDFRIVSDPSNLSGLTAVRDDLDLGRVWTSGDRIGWSIAAAPELAALYKRLVQGRAMRRFKMVDAWEACLRLLPTFTERRSTEAERRKAFEHYTTLARQYSPEHRVLPPDYFKLWA